MHCAESKDEHEQKDYYTSTIKEFKNILWLQYDQL